LSARNTLLVQILILVAVAASAAPASEPATPVLDAMRTELERSMDELGAEPEPPYFLSYEIAEQHTALVSASFGALDSTDERRTRQLDVDLRVGDYGLDNSHSIRGQFGGDGALDRFAFVPIPVEDDADAIRAVLWNQTDARYKRARERLTRIRTNVQVKVEQEDRSADFSREPAQEYVGEAVELALDRTEWEERVRRYSAPFAEHGDIFQGRALVSATVETRWYVNSDGTRLRVSQPRYRLVVSALTKADDGMELPRYESFFATTAAGLPDDEAVLEVVRGMVSDLLALRVAPVVDPFTGPAILSGRASGVFFHEVFGHRIEGHRQKYESEGQTFKKKLGERLLPEGFSVYFDPTVSELAGFELAGQYPFDNEGVKARRVPVIEQGVFKRFLMSRSPIEGFPNSNGHGRRQPGYSAVARQSNLIVEVAEPVSEEELKRRLLSEIERQGAPYGLRFVDIEGGFTATGRTTPNAFNVLPIKVFRIFPDGREELVRGVDLIGTPLATFGKIVAGGDRLGVFNGTCGAESGGVPVSAVSPPLLISEIEVQKKQKSQDRPPILEAPIGGSEEGRIDAADAAASAPELNRAGPPGGSAEGGVTTAPRGALPTTGAGRGGS
jgi:predicted Zn-dependent protease